MTTTKYAVAALFLLAATSRPIFAEDNPSADQIIQSLRPGAGMTTGTRGIRPVSPENPAPATSDATEPAAPHMAGTRHHAASHATHGTAVAAQAAPSVKIPTVQFATNSADLTPEAVKTLSELGRALSSDTLAHDRFRIEGHTDTVGSAESNKALSDRRAQAVVTFLTATFQIDPSRLEAVGKGEDGLLVQTPANVAEPRNRRVLVINLGA